MPDQTDQPPPRMTTAQAAKLAQDAMALAADNGELLSSLSEKFTDLDQRLRDRETAHAELRDETMGRLSGVRPDDAATRQDLDDLETRVREEIGHATAATQFATRDQVDGRIHEALQPLHDEVHELRNKGTLTPESTGSLRGILARLEDAERKVAATDTNGMVIAVAQQLHPTLSDLRRRLDEVEKSSGVIVDPEGLNALGRRVTQLEQATADIVNDPVSQTLAEDALADQVQAQVTRALEPATAELSRMLNNAFERLEEVEKALDVAGTRAPQAAGNWPALPATSAGVRATLRGAETPNGLGAARKVLELMRMVTHIGKTRQADMGQGGSFKFRGIDEAMDTVGHAMREVGLILSTEVVEDQTSTTPVTKKGDGRNGPYESTVLWTTTKLTMRYTFVDPQDGSTHTIEMAGEGRDASDKSTSKAGSMAFKYALLQALCIPVNGLDDSDASPPQVMENERDTPPASRRPGPAPYGSLPGDITGRERAAQQAPPARTSQDKAGRVVEALQAIRNVHRVEGGPQAQYNRLVQIMNQVKREELLEFSVEGSTLNQHGQAAMRTLQTPGPEESPRTEDMPPDQLDHHRSY